MHGIAIERSCAYTFFATAALEIQRKHVRGFDRLCRCESRTDRFAAAGKSGEVVKRDPTRQKHARELIQRAVELNHHAALCFTKHAEFRLIVRIVRENSQTLDDERRQQLELFFLSDWTMNAGREDHRYLCR